MKAVAIGLIRFYRAAISPALPSACRYLPTCSEYCIEAIEQYGVVKGSWAGLRRIARCHPLHEGGYDPVPPAEHRPMNHPPPQV